MENKWILLNVQEPFDLLKEDFLEDLHETADDGSNQVEALNRALRFFDIAPLLNMLYEFIETFVRHCESKEKDWS